MGYVRRAVAVTVNPEKLNVHSRFTPFASINSDYRGELKVLLANLGAAPFAIARGERIAQLVVQRIEHARLREVTNLEPTPRGAGSTGNAGKPQGAKRPAGGSRNKAPRSSPQPPVTLMCRATAGCLVRRSMTKSWPLGLRAIASSMAHERRASCALARRGARKSAASS